MDALREIVTRTRWWLLIIFIGAVGLFYAYGSYHNSLHACERGNVVREAIVIATSNATANAHNGKAGYSAATKKLTEAPFANPDGTVRCDEAVTPPLPFLR
ncbi:MAG: hypothetical protein JST59_20355 [Actinobacteria bacterium]|nr:hypothetical protein [Actinomycetota bacterium]